mmetsp:Transcript_26022/g.46138  ORF Transcript_26022/g.46138 Transcript_26022/m.46138 type:complete len:275 (-) Transcript_26022:4665-5489(-)
MPIGTGVAAFIAMLWHGIKESHIYHYKTPRLKSTFKGGSQWKEVRFRHPAPANEASNGQLSARETPHDHWKVPYPYSKFNVRHYYSPEKDDKIPQVGRTLIDVTKMSPVQEARFLDYVEGDAEGNAIKKERYQQYFERTKTFGISSQIHEKIESLKTEPLKFMELMREAKAEADIINRFDDEGLPEKELEYYANPDTYIAPYDLHLMSSYEMQHYLELEAYLDTWAEKLETEGQEVRLGDTSIWQVVGDDAREDQRRTVNHTLKMRNIEERKKD